MTLSENLEGLVDFDPINCGFIVEKAVALSSGVHSTVNKSPQTSVCPWRYNRSLRDINPPILLRLTYDRQPLHQTC